MNENITNKLSKVADFFKQKNVQNIIIVVLLLSMLIFSSWVRLQNLPLLVDSTTGKNIPLALDPFYFLRVAETISESGNGLPMYDTMRYPSMNVGFSNEILPQAIIFLHKVGEIFNKNITIQFVDIIAPVIFFILGMIAFFFLILVLTKSKWTAFISSMLLGIIPTYLYRTMAGFTDHEAIGMCAFFFTLLFYSLALKYFSKHEITNKISIASISLGVLVGFFSAFTIACWGGVANFVFMIIPLSFVIFWLVQTQTKENVQTNENDNDKNLPNFLMFYLTWFVSSILFGLIYGFNFLFLLSKVALSSSSLICSFVLLFLIIDFILIKFKDKL